MIDFFVFLGIGGAAGTAIQTIRYYRRRALTAEKKLARIAVTDDDLVCMLEASDSPMVNQLKSMLEEANKVLTEEMREKERRRLQSYQPW